MTGIGIVVLLFAYACIEWGVNAIQGTPQSSFASKIFPFAGLAGTSPSQPQETSTTQKAGGSQANRVPVTSKPVPKFTQATKNANQG